MSRVAIFGCKSTTRYLYRELSQFLPIAAIVTISPEKAADQQVADYDDLTDLVGETEVHVAERYQLTGASDLAYFEAQRFDIGFVAGWQRIIPDAVLATLSRGAYGMHGSSQDLPFGRGRSPMNWSIIEGRGWFFTNLFRYLPGVDDGPVADTLCFSINASDTAETLHFKNLLSMVHLVRRNIDGLLAGTAPLREQPQAEPTYYPKRDPADSIIDWGSDVAAIDRHVRAVAPPFSGAFSFIGERRVTILRAAPFYTDVEAHPFHDAAPGTVCMVLPNGKFGVRCVGGVLLVHEHQIDGAPIAPGDLLHSPDAAIKRFPRNRFGMFDLPG
jgi:UDP-4-amino-4-deoxy-L-arabinose formyltransferase/UDP-glucuronic acid dehydrogenase (UDP-4-keto-hexauronic acid decarboxylating)